MIIDHDGLTIFIGGKLVYGAFGEDFSTSVQKKQWLLKALRVDSKVSELPFGGFGSIDFIFSFMVNKICISSWKWYDATRDVLYAHGE